MKTVLCSFNAKYIHSCLAIRYLKEYARYHGHKHITLCEFSINELPAYILSELYQQDPDVLCFSCYIWNIELTLEICAQIHILLPDTIIVLGGPEVSYDSVTLLKRHPYLAVIIRGEGEVSFTEVLDRLQKGQTLEGVKGITYRQGEKIYVNEDRPLIKNLDSIPFPYEEELSAFQDRIIYYESSRGCPFHCSYCLSSVSHGVRYFSLARVKQDLKQLAAYQVREIKFVDRTFNCNEKRAREIMKFLIEHNTHTRMHFEVDASLLSDEMMDFLDQVPPDRFYFEIGIQSTYPPALEAVNRKGSWKQIYKNVRRLVESNRIRIHLDLIAGLPYESYEHFHRSFNQVYELQADVIQLGFLKLLKGSPLREESSQYGYAFQPQPPYQVLKNAYMSYDDLLQLERMEDLVDRYYNRNHMPQTIIYLTRILYQGDAFKFFEDLAAYWQERRLYGRGHKLDKLYQYLYDFTLQSHPEHTEIVHDLLKYDYLCNHHKNTLPDGIQAYPDLDLNNNVMFEHQEFRHLIDPDEQESQRNLRKRIHLEYFQYHPLTLREESVYILFAYPPGGHKASAHFLPPSQITPFLTY